MLSGFVVVAVSYAALRQLLCPVPASEQALLALHASQGDRTGEDRVERPRSRVASVSAAASATTRSAAAATARAASTASTAAAATAVATAAAGAELARSHSARAAVAVQHLGAAVASRLSGRRLVYSEHDDGTSAADEGAQGARPRDGGSRDPRREPGTAQGDVRVIVLGDDTPAPAPALAPAHSHAADAARGQAHAEVEAQPARNAGEGASMDVSSSQAAEPSYSARPVAAGGRQKEMV